jgi:hypothetical protein
MMFTFPRYSEIGGDMAKKAVLSQPGQTGPKDAKDWPSDWPDLPDVLSFWLAINSTIRPSGTLRAERGEGGIRDFAVRYRLLDKSQAVPQWLLFVGTKGGIPEAFLNSVLDVRSFKLELPSRYSLSEYAQQPSLSGRGGFGLNNALATSAPTGPIPHTRQLQLEELNRSAVRNVERSLYYVSGFKSPSEAKKRVLDAIGNWLDVQYFWCDALIVYGGVPELPVRLADEDVSLFIRFQCQGLPVRKLIGSCRDEDHRTSRESAIRKTLKRVSKKLGIPLRREQTGRPPRKTGKQS